MSEPSESFGLRFSATQPRDWFELHTTEGDRGEFVEYDAALGRLFDGLIRGKRLLKVDAARGKADRRRVERSRSDADVVTLKISDADRATLEAVLAPEAQQARGAWYVPETERPPVGLIEFSHWRRVEPRFALSAADAHRAVITLDTPDAIAVWAALEPIMTILVLPLKLRSGYQVGTRRPEALVKDWRQVDTAYAALAIDTAPLEVFRDGRTWATMTIEEVLAAREAVDAAWTSAPNDVGPRAIALIIGQLVERYYQKATKNGTALRSSVLSKSSERLLSAAFGGDWLAFLHYLGERPHASEKIVTAVEQTALLATGQSQAAQAAAATGVPVEEIEKVLAVYWGGQARSPVEQRAAVIADWWREFDQMHAQQAKGDQTLWGLLGDRGEDMTPDYQDGRWIRRGYELMPDELTTRIAQLWGTKVLPQWPDALVSEPFPYAALAETLGPGVEFWEQVSLTCWFICEGPYSRTSIDQMADYYERLINRLDEFGCPADDQLFSDLLSAEAKLTDRPGYEHGEVTAQQEVEVAEGISVTITASVGPAKKDGFEYLRDVVTRYRRAWAEQFLDKYIHAIWERDLRSVGERYHRQIANKGRPFTALRFATVAKDAANHWFGGDLSQLSSALGIAAPDPPMRRCLMPKDRAGFVRQLREALKGQLWEESEDEPDHATRIRNLRRAELARLGPSFIQVREATGEWPSQRDSVVPIHTLREALGEDIEQGLASYISLIERVLDAMTDASHKARTG